jgi:hypothetical protein
MGAGGWRAIRDARQHEVYPAPNPHVKQPRCLGRARLASPFHCGRCDQEVGATPAQRKIT